MSGYGYSLPQGDDKPKVCVICGLVDHPLPTGHVDVETGKPMYDHAVVIDLVWIDRAALTSQEREQGYLPWASESFKGRRAKVRLICRDCLNQAEDTRKAWADFYETKRKDAEDSEDGSFYFHLCS